MTSDQAPTPLRPLLLAAGWLCVVLGTAGTMLPLLPTTPFLLLAAACFARSSPRVHQWLRDHRALGPFLRAWEERRALPPGAKLPALLVVLVTFGISITWATQIVWVRGLLALIGLTLFVFLVRLPVMPSASQRRELDASAESSPGES
ncbi:MAG: inner membrane protein [Planctomycetota bacterium]|nr:MAG: inner membrane protein [Planctomycetota bacterium]